MESDTSDNNNNNDTLDTALDIALNRKPEIANDDIDYIIAGVEKLLSQTEFFTQPANSRLEVVIMPHSQVFNMAPVHKNFTKDCKMAFHRNKEHFDKSFVLITDKVGKNINEIPLTSIYMGRLVY